MSGDPLFDRPQFSIPQADKEAMLFERLRMLDVFHRERCPEYRSIADSLFGPLRRGVGIVGLPYLPVSLFKTRWLTSVPRDRVVKILTSSGTTGEVSRVGLDHETAQLQTAALAKIMTTVLGPRRLPMIVVESRGVIVDRREFSARGAGMLGMSTFGRKHFYALDDEMHLDLEGLEAFLDEFGGGPFVIFGFTFMIWEFFLARIEGLRLDLSNAVLIHSGGWKKLQDRAVDNSTFKNRLAEVAGITRVFNFYGMVEQVGSVFLEGEDGFLYAPNFADVIIRDPETWEELPAGSQGVIQVVSSIPRSYPGHSLLTEDLGVVHGIDDSSCGRLGKRFSVIGRVPRTELRGCSDTFVPAGASR